MGALLGFHASPLAHVSDRPSQIQVLRVLLRSSRVPSLARLMDSSGVIPWSMRLPLGVSRMEGLIAEKDEWWSWDLLGTALEILSNVLVLTEKRKRRRKRRRGRSGEEEGREEEEEEVEEGEEEEEEGDGDGEESLNAHTLRLSSLAHACVHLLRKSAMVLARRSSIHRSSTQMSSREGKKFYPILDDIISSFD